MTYPMTFRTFITAALCVACLTAPAPKDAHASAYPLNKVTPADIENVLKKYQKSQKTEQEQLATIKSEQLKVADKLTEADNKYLLLKCPDAKIGVTDPETTAECNKLRNEQQKLASKLVRLFGKQRGIEGAAIIEQAGHIRKLAILTAKAGPDVKITRTVLNRPLVSKLKGRLYGGKLSALKNADDIIRQVIDYEDRQIQGITDSYLTKSGDKNTPTKIRLAKAFKRNDAIGRIYQSKENLYYRLAKEISIHGAVAQFDIEDRVSQEIFPLPKASALGNNKRGQANWIGAKKRAPAQNLSADDYDAAN